MLRYWGFGNAVELRSRVLQPPWKTGSGPDLSTEQKAGMSCYAGAA